jgi:glycine cleavage system H protein
MSGEVTESNEALKNTPELVNKDPYGKGWMVKVRISDPKEAESLLNASAYKALIGK